MNPVPVFWILALALVAATVVTLLWPLVRARRAADAPAGDDAAAAVFRDQKRQLDDEYAAGALSAAERDAAIDELAARFGSELALPGGAGDTSTSRAPWIAALVVVAVVPAAAVLTYVALGNPDALRTARAPDASHALTQSQVVAMVESLAQKMKANPDDANGWALLARSYAALQRFQESADAYAEAAKRLPGNPDLLADWADALAMAQGRTLQGKPAEIAQRALAIDPKHRKSLALAATAAMERRDFDGALRYWKTLAADLPAGSDEAREIASVIAEVEAARTGAGGKAKRAAPAVAAAPDGAASGAAVTLRGRVEVAPALAAKAAPDDAVFVFARPVDGSRMPLAVLRLRARDLPREFTLDDSMGMAPGVKLSAAPQVIVEARISKSGNATPSSGDLSGKSAAVKPGAAGVRIVIDQVVP